MDRYQPYNLRNREINMNNSPNSNQNPIPPPPPQPNPLPLPNANPNMEANRIFDQAERIMKSLQTPQAVRELQPFDGNPVKLHSFLRSVDHLMPFIEPLKNSPFEKIWLQAIRAKIINEADQVLETYGTALDWDEIKANLIAYYNDKRDPVTLTRELFQIQQVGSIEQFFGHIQNLLSLLINHTNISTDNENVKQDRILTHKENALQVFLAGLKEPIGGNVRARQPKTLKQAFDAAIEERNFQSRGGLSRPNLPARPPKPINFPPNLLSHRPMPYSQFYTRQPMPQPQPYFPRQQAQFPTPPMRQNFMPRFTPNQQGNNPSVRQPQRALPAPEPIDNDKSIRSKYVNYVNRPPFNYPARSTQRGQFTPAVPSRPARITELRNMEQEWNNSYDHNTYEYDYYYGHPPMQNLYSNNYYEMPYAGAESHARFEDNTNMYQEPPQTIPENETDGSLEQDNTQGENEPVDHLNFQLETPPYLPG